MKPKQLQKEYTSNGGVPCPLCGSDDIEPTDSVQVGTGCAWQDINCITCQATWQDVYVLDGYTNLRDAEGDEIKTTD